MARKKPSTDIPPTATTKVLPFYQLHKAAMAPTLKALEQVEVNLATDPEFEVRIASALRILGSFCVTQAAGNATIVVDHDYEASLVLEEQDNAMTCVTHQAQDVCSSIALVVKRAREARA